MAGSVNKVIIVGNLGADPEVRRTQDDRMIVTLRVATSETWRDKATGERREKTEWHRIVIFSEGLAKVAEQYLKKGSKVYLEGQISTRKWQDNTGQDRYSTEIVLQGFNATLTLLDKAQGSGYQQGGNGPQDYGYDASRAAAGTQTNNGAAAGTQSSNPAAGPGGDRSSSQSDTSPGSGISRDMDDDIPF